MVRAIGLTLPDVEAADQVRRLAGSEGRRLLHGGIGHSSLGRAGTLVVRIDLDDRDALLEDAPETYYLTDYYRPHPVVLARLSHLDRDALRDLLSVSRRLTLAKDAGSATVLPAADKLVAKTDFKSVPSTSRRSRRRCEGCSNGCGARSARRSPEPKKHLDTNRQRIN